MEMPSSLFYLKHKELSFPIFLGIVDLYIRIQGQFKNFLLVAFPAVLNGGGTGSTSCYRKHLVLHGSEMAKLLKMEEEKKATAAGAKRKRADDGQPTLEEHNGTRMCTGTRMGSGTRIRVRVPVWYGYPYPNRTRGYLFLLSVPER
jgi:hypothetical protein